MAKIRLSIIPMRLIGLVLGGMLTLKAGAETFILPPPDVDLIGQVQVDYAVHEDTLLDIARRYSIGHQEIVQANPGVDLWIPGEGTPVVVPSRYILPDAPRKGIVLNVPEMRLYYYPKPTTGEKPVVITHPVSIGRMDWKTPLGKTSVIAKHTDPNWYPPASIKAEHAANGDPLPDVVPAGPDNPLGRYALRLGKPGYLIHSTNKPFGIGMRVTHGCVRMYPEDIERMFPQVPVNTPVYIVNQPVKVGWLGNSLFMEVHPSLEEEVLPLEEAIAQAEKIVADKAGSEAQSADPEAIRLLVEQASGIAVPISRSN